MKKRCDLCHVPLDKDVYDGVWIFHYCYDLDNMHVCKECSINLEEQFDLSARMFERKEK